MLALAKAFAGLVGATCTWHRLLTHVALYFFRHRLEGLFYVERVVCGRFQVWHADLLGEFFALLLTDLPLRLQVALVADEYLAHVGLRILLNLVDPRAHVLKRLAICHIVHYNDALGATIVAGRECSESFLTCCVPL